MDGWINGENKHTRCKQTLREGRFVSIEREVCQFSVNDPSLILSLLSGSCFVLWNAEFFPYLKSLLELSKVHNMFDDLRAAI